MRILTNFPWTVINEANSQLENMFEVLVIEETDSCSASS
jgi:hypothetical protein